MDVINAAELRLFMVRFFPSFFVFEKGDDAGHIDSGKKKTAKYGKGKKQ